MSGLWMPYKEKYEVCEDGRIRLKGGIDLETYDYGGRPGSRYVGVTLGKPYYVHRVVCEAFHGAPPTPKHTVEHNDGNKRNNHKDNLCWLPMGENNKRKGVRRAPTSQNKGLRQHYIRKDSHTKKDGTVSDYFYVRIRKSDLKYFGKFSTLEEAIRARDAVLDEYDASHTRMITVSSHCTTE